MRMPIATMALGALLAGVAAADEDVFAFIPPGGRGLLADLLADEPEGALAREIATARPAAEWAALLAEGDAAVPGAGALDEWQSRTLADYLAYAGALPDPGRLPRDGRDLVLSDCQSCHIVTVVVTQDRPREAWLGTMHKPSHIEIDLTEAERGQIADYLVVNGAIPIDAVPPELRAGGASY